MYEIAMKNKDKKEFDWNTNNACIDFHLVINGVDNYYFSGSYCYDQYEFYKENNLGQQDNTYNYNEFERESIKAIRRFLYRKNKKEYKVDEALETLKIKLWNNDTEKEEDVSMGTFLTYCP